MATLRQISLDFRHDLSRKIANNCRCKKPLRKQAMAGTSLYPDVAENCIAPRFHIFKWIFFSYYSYKWAKFSMLMVFAYFKKRNFQAKSQQNSKTTYFQGGTRLPMELYKRLGVKNQRRMHC
jgi:peptidyl-dipeptidase Dcp